MPRVSRHLAGPDGRVLCAQDNRADDLGPPNGPLCKKCIATQARGGKRPPPVYARHYYHYTVRDGWLHGGVYCRAGRIADPDRDVPINLRGMRPEHDICKSCLRKGGLPSAGDYPASGADEQVVLAKLRRDREEERWARVRAVFDKTFEAWQEGRMSWAEMEIRFRTEYISKGDP